MGTSAVGPADPAAAASVRLLGRLSDGYAGGIAARLWTGETWAVGPPAGFTLVLKHPGAVRAMLWPFDRVSVGESYIFDDFDVEGDMLAFIDWLRHLIALMTGWGLRAKLGILRALLALPRRRNPRDPAKAGRPRTAGQGNEADRRGISLHYDRPGAFYSLFLGAPAMQYTCAYFHAATDPLGDAQRQKMDHICQKLRLRAGQRFLDIGCGWGGLLRHAVQYYGVTGVGITLAGEQAEWAIRTNREMGLADKIQIEFWHYRDMPFDATFDAVSSIGMTEEVGNRNLPGYLRGVTRALKPGGVYLHHAINLRPHTPYPLWTPFTQKYVFPNGDLQTLPFVVGEAARAGLEARDVENLREHYTLTLRAWLRGLEANRAEAVRLTDEVTYRIYRLFMAAGTMAFDTSVYQLNQVLFVKPAPDGTAGLPPTRADWYASRANA